MAVFKCKMCGGELDVREGQTIVTCDYCGTKQTVPADCSEELRTLYNRANVLRMKSEFDKAEQIYERIITADPKQAEAYWGALLCKYGIEYVEDPKTYKRIPTCHRVSYDAMEADEYYKLALENADSVQRRIYEEEAKYIDGVQKEILAISSKEEAFDVFICYKETDENGKRTKDSTIANDIYYHLTQEGYRVFYAAITLEDKLGSAYEPVIFAALNSAKVMLVLGTRPEYFNAVWVKNEWSRYLKLIKNDNNKLLIPCYQDMDAYELPEEFAHLQAQDMGKVGFIADIVRGIKKVIGKEDRAKESVISVNGSAAPLLKRAYMFAAEKDWNNANQYAERVLDIEPENAEAYIVKLLCDLKVPTVEELGKQLKPFTNNANFKKAEKFADDKIAALLKQLVEAVKDFICKTAKEKIDSGNLIEMTVGKTLLSQISELYEVSSIIDECDKIIKNCQSDMKRKLSAVRNRLSVFEGMIGVTDGYYVGVKTDGQLVSGVCDDGKIKLRSFRKKYIISVAVGRHSRGNYFLYGLTVDGRVLCINSFSEYCSFIPGWQDIVKITCDLRDRTIAGIQKDGTVKIVWRDVLRDGNPWIDGCEREFEDVKDWKNIRNLVVYNRVVVGVTSTGKVFVSGNKKLQDKVAEWSDIVEVATDGKDMIGLKSYGTLVRTSADEKELNFGGGGGMPLQSSGILDNALDTRLQNQSLWTDIVSIKPVIVEKFSVVALKADGTVLTDIDSCKEVNGWTNIVSIASDYRGSCLGLKEDGSIVYHDKYNYSFSSDSDIAEWKLFNNIDEIEASREMMLKMIAEEREKLRTTHKEKAERLKRLTDEKVDLVKELSSLGFFAIKRKGEIKTRLEQIEIELKKLS